MRAIKKWFSLMLCVVLLCGLMTGALATENATGAAAEWKAPPDAISIDDLYLEGREVSFWGQMHWLSPAILDERTNGALEALFEALEIEGRYAYEDTANGYVSFVLKVSGEDVLPFGAVAEDNVVYYDSPLYGPPFKLDLKDIKTFMARYGTFMDTMIAESSGTDTAAGTTFHDLFVGLAENLPDGSQTMTLKESQELSLEQVRMLYSIYGMDDMFDGLLDWVASVEPVPYEDQLESIFAMDVASATCVDITKEKVVELFDIVIDSFENNETFAAMMLQNINAQRASDSQVTMEDFMAELPEALGEMREALHQIPDDMILRVYEGFDADGSKLLTEMEVLIPLDDIDENEFVGYFEHVTDTLNAYFAGFVGADGIDFVMNPNPEIAGGIPDDGFLGVLTIYASDEEVGYVVISTNSVAHDVDGDRAWDGSLLLSYMDQYSEYGVQFLVSQFDVAEGEDVQKEGVLEAYLLMDTETFPLFSVDYAVGTGEPQNPPFDVAGTIFEEPASMTDAEFTSWVETIGISAMQSMMGVMSKLPAEVFELMMPETSTAAEYSEETLSDEDAETEEAIAAPTLEVSEEPAEDIEEDAAIEATAAPAKEKKTKQ
ncbi:hypothetical protein LJC74_00235 [Eubacteriales bacterium OttesenSCG-928-A19]|nr:hypothetical protein [Eubacteriales bacterium OttesenSCG-928-A19]